LKQPLNLVRFARLLQAQAVGVISAAEFEARWADLGYDAKSRTCIGSGHFSTVYRTRATKDKVGLKAGTEVAAKELKACAASSKQTTKFEGDAFLALNRCDEFVKMHEPLKDDKTGLTCFVFEYCAGGSLASALDSDVKLTINDVRIAAVRLLRGLQQLKRVNLVHRDIAPRNLFLRRKDDFSSLVIGDVGCAELAGSKECMSSPKGFSAHMASECLDDGNFSFSSDLFSAGCVLLSMLMRARSSEVDADCEYWLKLILAGSFG
jgi:serine/threonine protein kinase